MIENKISLWHKMETPKSLTLMLIYGIISEIVIAFMSETYLDDGISWAENCRLTRFWVMVILG